MDKFTQQTHILTAAEGQTATFTHAHLASTQSYYRSTTFTANSGINPLVAAAAALLSLNPKLQQTPAYENSSDLYQHLVHEIKAFETNAQNRGYNPETILVARYILCSTLDETIIHAPWYKEGNWKHKRLLQTFHQETFHQNDTYEDRFFVILERISQAPAQHLDLLELIYLCLSMGHQGKFQHETANKIKLDEIVDNLYQCIHAHRKEPEPILPTHTTPTNPTTPCIPRAKMGLWKIALICGSIIAVVYLGLNYKFNTARKTVYQQFSGIQKSLSLKTRK